MKQTFKEYLRPKNGYSEGPMSLVTHNGILYKLDYMFELSADLPVTLIPLDDLRWQVQNLQADEARVNKTDIKVPIIVTPQNGQYIILDGTHRVLKALKAGEKSVPARVVFADILGMTRLGSGSDVVWASNVDDLNPYLGESAGSLEKDVKAALTRDDVKKLDFYSNDKNYQARVTTTMPGKKLMGLLEPIADKNGFKCEWEDRDGGVSFIMFKRLEGIKEAKEQPQVEEATIQKFKYTGKSDNYYKDAKLEFKLEDGRRFTRFWEEDDSRSAYKPGDKVTVIANRGWEDGHWGGVFVYPAGKTTGSNREKWVEI